MCLPNTLCEAMKDIRDSLDSLGGVKVLLPLLHFSGDAAAAASYDDAAMGQEDDDGADSPRRGSSSSSFSSHRLGQAATALDILFCFLRPSAANERLLSTDFFPLLAALLRRLPTREKNTALYEVIATHSKEGSGVLATHPVWRSLLVTHIWGDFELWTGFPFKALSRLFANLLNMAANDPEYIARRVPVSKFIHVLTSVYAEPSTSSGSSDSQDASSSARLDKDQLLLIRTLITQTIFVLLSRQEQAGLLSAVEDNEAVSSVVVASYYRGGHGYGGGGAAGVFEWDVHALVVFVSSPFVIQASPSLAIAGLKILLRLLCRGSGDIVVAQDDEAWGDPSDNGAKADDESYSPRTQNKRRAGSGSGSNNGVRGRVLRALCVPMRHHHHHHHFNTSPLSLLLSMVIDTVPVNSGSAFDALGPKIDASSSSDTKMPAVNPKVRLLALASVVSVLGCALREGPLPNPYRADAQTDTAAANASNRDWCANFSDSSSDGFSDSSNDSDSGSDSDNDGDSGADDGISMRGKSATTGVAPIPPPSSPSREGSKDVFARLGVPVSSLGALFEDIASSLKNNIRAAPNDSSALHQMRLGFSLLQAAAHGALPRVGMLTEIDCLWADDGVSSPSTDSGSSSSSSENSPGVAAPSQSYHLLYEGRVMCLPMVLPALMSLLQIEQQQHEMSSPSSLSAVPSCSTTRASSMARLRLRLLLGLKSASLSGFCSREGLLGLPLWQVPFLAFIQAEQAPATSTTLSANAGNAAALAEQRASSASLCDVASHLIVDLHLHALRFGSPEAGLVVVLQPGAEDMRLAAILAGTVHTAAPVGGGGINVGAAGSDAASGDNVGLGSKNSSSRGDSDNYDDGADFMVSGCDPVSSSDAHLLPPKQLLLLVNRGSRETGAATVKRTLSAVRAYSATTTTGSVCGQDSSKEGGRGDNSTLDLGLFLLQLTANVLRREQESQNLSTKATPICAPSDSNTGTVAAEYSSIEAEVDDDAATGGTDPALAVRRRIFELNGWLLSSLALGYLTELDQHHPQHQQYQPGGGGDDSSDVRRSLFGEDASSTAADTDQMQVERRQQQQQQIGGYIASKWGILSSLLAVLNPGQVIQQTLTTGRYQDGMDRLMLGVAVGFRLGREVTQKMAASALAMQSSDEADGPAAFDDRTPLSSAFRTNNPADSPDEGGSPYSSEQRERSATGGIGSVSMSNLFSPAGATNRNTTANPLPALSSHKAGPASTRQRAYSATSTQISASPHPNRDRGGGTRLPTPARGRETALSRTVDNVLWLLLRALLRIYLDSGGGYESSPLSGEGVTAGVAAVAAIEGLLQEVRPHARAFADRESLYVVARLSEALASTRRPNSRGTSTSKDDSHRKSWFQAGLGTLARLLLRLRHGGLVDLLRSELFTYEGDMAADNPLGGIDTVSRASEAAAVRDSIAAASASATASPQTQGLQPLSPTHVEERAVQQLTSLLEASLALIPEREAKQLALKEEESNHHLSLQSTAADGSAVTGGEAVLAAVARALELGMVCDGNDDSGDNTNQDCSGSGFSWLTWSGALRPILANNAHPLSSSTSPAGQSLSPAVTGNNGVPETSSSAATISHHHPPPLVSVALLSTCRAINDSNQRQQAQSQMLRHTITQASMACAAAAKGGGRVVRAAQEWSETEASRAWERLSEGLFNERGPWGVGVGASPSFSSSSLTINTDANANPNTGGVSSSSSDYYNNSSAAAPRVYWCLDLAETSARTCIKLRRDATGTAHENSSSKCTTPRASFSTGYSPHSHDGGGGEYVFNEAEEDEEGEIDEEEREDEENDSLSPPASTSVSSSAAGEAYIVSALSNNSSNRASHTSVNAGGGSSSSSNSNRPSFASGRVSFSLPAETEDTIAALENDRDSAYGAGGNRDTMGGVTADSPATTRVSSSSMDGAYSDANSGPPGGGAGTGTDLMQRADLAASLAKFVVRGDEGNNNDMEGDKDKDENEAEEDEVAGTSETSERKGAATGSKALAVDTNSGESSKAIGSSKTSGKRASNGSKGSNKDNKQAQDDREKEKRDKEARRARREAKRREKEQQITSGLARAALSTPLPARSELIPAAAASSYHSQRVLFSAEAEIITRACNYCNLPPRGTLMVTPLHLVFLSRADHSNPDTRAAEAEAEASGRRASNNSVSSSGGRFHHMRHCRNQGSCCWSAHSLVMVAQRYYQLRFVAVELFFTDRTSLLISLPTAHEASRMAGVIRSQVQPPLLARFLGRRPETIMRKSFVPKRLAGGSLNASNLYPSAKAQLTENNATMVRLKDAWINREISNFDYLMKLNSIAGRTYNDLGQYPVFPWVLSDYQSTSLDLSDPHSYRDLKYPMGAQNKRTRVEQQARYQDLESAYVSSLNALAEAEDDDGMHGGMMPPFHWGSHYSVAGFVLWYLVRLEPFTSLHVQLQDGRFDKPDRIFASIGAAYEGCTNNAADVKELVPEMFYLPEALCNNNKVHFGTTQQGDTVDDVKLPPWAKDAHDFIFQHRLALESDYVSNNLHRWIDLIFGCRQRPPHLGGTQDCVDSCNVFFHLTYSGAVDLEGLKESDPTLYEQYACQIAEFGQTPAQLFSKPHEQRKSFRKADLFWPFASSMVGVDTIPHREEIPDRPLRTFPFRPIIVAAHPVVFIHELASSEKLVTIDTARVTGQHKWTKLPPDVKQPFMFKGDAAALDDSRSIKRVATAAAATGGSNSGSNSSGSSNSGSSNSSGSSGIFSSITSGVSSLLRSDKTGSSSSDSTSDGTPTRAKRSSIMGSMVSGITMGGGSATALRVGVPFSPLLVHNGGAASQQATSGDTSGSTNSSATTAPGSGGAGGSSTTSSYFGQGIISSIRRNSAGSISGAGGKNGIGNGKVPASRLKWAVLEDERSRKKSSFQSTRNSVSQSSLGGTGAAGSSPNSPARSPLRGPSSSLRRGVTRASGKMGKAAAQAAAAAANAKQNSNSSSNCHNGKGQPRKTPQSNTAPASEPGISSKLFAVLEDAQLNYLRQDYGTGLGSESGTGAGGGAMQAMTVGMGSSIGMSGMGSKSSKGGAMGISSDMGSTPLSLEGKMARLLFTCGHYDNTVRITNLDSGRLVHAIRKHSDVVTCLALSSDYGQWWLVTGSRDCSVQVWEIGLHPPSVKVPLAGHNGSASAGGHIHGTNSNTNGSGDGKGSGSSTSNSNTGGGYEGNLVKALPLHILYGHDDCVVTVALNAPLDLVCSGSDDGTVMMHSMRSGDYVRTITRTITASISAKTTSPPATAPSMVPSSSSSASSSAAGAPGSASAAGVNNTQQAAAEGGSNLNNSSISWAGISPSGYIVTYSADDNMLCSYTVNGTFLASQETGEQLYALLFSEDGLVLLTGGQNALVVLRWVRTLELADDGPRTGLEAVIDGSLITGTGADGQVGVLGEAELGGASIAMQQNQQKVGKGKGGAATPILSPARGGGVDDGGNGNRASNAVVVVPPFASPIRSLYLTSNERHLLVGDEGGNLRVVVQDSDYLRDRLQRKLIEIGILDD
jgi:hypothetical protein